MKFTRQLGDFRKALAGTEKQIAQAVTGAMRDATDGLKTDLRSDVAESGLGRRLANTWRGKTYPDGAESVEAAAFVWSKAPKIADAFDRGVTITPGNGRKYLAIPTDNARRIRSRERITPAIVEQRTGQKLHFVRGRGSTAFLIGVPRVARARRRGAARPKGVVMFILVPQARLRKRLDIQSIADRWAAKVPTLVSSHWS